MRNVVGRLLQQNPDVAVMERVEHIAAAPLTNNQTQVAQDAQLMRDRRLLHSDRIRQLVHRAGAFAQPRENADATWSRERLHRLGNLAGGFCVDRGGLGLPIDTVSHGRQRYLNGYSDIQEVAISQVGLNNTHNFLPSSSASLPALQGRR